MNTTRITKALATNNSIHKPVPRVLMTYEAGDAKEKSNRLAFVLNLNNDSDMTRLTRTLKWAALNHVEVTFRPI